MPLERYYRHNPRDPGNAQYDHAPDDWRPEYRREIASLLTRAADARRRGYLGFARNYVSVAQRCQANAQRWQVLP